MAHLFNDIDLGGSSLQGCGIYDSARAMHYFINMFLKNKIVFSGLSSDQTLLIKEQCQKLLKLLGLVMQAREYPENKEELLILQFEQEGRVWIPGGGNVALMYQFKKDINGDCILWVWKIQGSGLNYHLYKETLNGKRYYPVKAYRIPCEKLDKIQLKAYFSLLFHATCNIEPLYKEIIPSIVALEGNEYEPKEFDNYKIEKQWSKTEGWQVIMTMIGIMVL